MPLTKSSTNNPSYDYKVYHVTTAENAKSILKEKQFRIPTQQGAIERGLKLGAAVYFGLDPNYCYKEAMNSLLDAEPQLLQNLSSKEDRIKIQNERLVCLEVDIKLINGPLSMYSFGNYRDGQLGKQYWPLIDHHSMTSATTPKQPLLPNGDTLFNDDYDNDDDNIPSSFYFSSEKWDETTERLTSEYLQGYYGIDVLTINENTDYGFEVAVYELDCIVNIKRWNSTNNDTNNGTDENKIMN